MAKNRPAESGQVGLITLLIMTVMLSVGISVVNRSTQDLKITRQEEEGSQVFNAAEAGVENALAGVTGCVDPDTDSACSGTFQLPAENGTSAIPVTVDYTIEPMHQFEGLVPENGVVQIDTSTAVGYTQASPATLVIEWGLNEDCSSGAAALEVIKYDQVANAVKQNAFRVDAAGCDRDDNFDTVSPNSGTGGYYARQTIDIFDNYHVVRIRPVYKDTMIRVTTDGSWDLPVEYYKIRSTGKSDVGNETKVIEVTRSLPALPSIFDYVLYSGTTLVK